MSTMIDRDNRRKVRDSLAHYLKHTNTKEQPHVRAERILQLIEREIGHSVIEEAPARRTRAKKTRAKKLMDTPSL